MRDKRFDVVVAGCGVAGLSAAVAAAEAGARVAVLERAPREERGGQSRYTEAYLRMKSEAEVTDNFETHLAENSSGYVDPDLIAESARPRASAPPMPRPSPSPSRTSSPPSPIRPGRPSPGSRASGCASTSCPRGIPDQIAAAAAAGRRRAGAGGGAGGAGGGARRRHPLRDDGGAAGAGRGRPRHRPHRPQPAGRAAPPRRPGGAGLRRVRGQCRDAGPLHRPARRLPAADLQGGNFNRGDGIRMALEAGAATAGDFGSYHAEPIDPRSGVSEPSVFVFPYGILVEQRTAGASPTRRRARSTSTWRDSSSAPSTLPKTTR